MCRMRYLYDMKKDGNNASVYCVDDVKNGAEAYNFLLNVSQRKVISPELFIAVGADDNIPEYLYTSTEKGIAYPKGNVNTDYRIFTLCGRYNKKPVCLSFHLYSDIGENPLTVLAILTQPNERETNTRLAERLVGVS